MIALIRITFFLYFVAYDVTPFITSSSSLSKRNNLNTQQQQQQQQQKQVWKRFSATTETSSATTTTVVSAAGKEDASALTEFMAQAHEEKLRALDRAEAKYKSKIQELEKKIEELEAPATGTEATSTNSYAFPSTNKLLSEKVGAYRDLLSKYFVKSQAEKMKAVYDAEQKLITKYEAIIADLKKAKDENNNDE